MLGDKNAIATIAVRDLNIARKFYRDILGLKEIATQGEELVTYKTGDTMLNVYRSQYAGTNKATAVAWDVDSELEEIVRTLKAKGIAFEHYEMPDIRREGDIHFGGDMKIAWFKDPDGNILNLFSEG
ncbi:MAG: VOC family protein [Betaproteobacteria bacterium]